MAQILTWKRRVLNRHSGGRSTIVYECRERPRLTEFHELIGERMTGQYWLIKDDPAGRKFQDIERALTALDALEGEG